MIRDWMTDAGTASFVVVSLLLFVTAFVLLCVNLWVHREHFRRCGEMALDPKDIEPQDLDPKSIDPPDHFSESNHHAVVARTPGSSVRNVNGTPTAARIQ